MTLMSTSELLADEPCADVDGFRFGTLGLPGRNTVSDVPLKGHLWSVTADARTTTLERDDRVVVKATGSRIVARDVVLGRSGHLTVKATGTTTIVVTPDGRGRPHVFHVRAGETTLRW